MSGWLTATVATVYVAGVVGWHRTNVHRNRKRADFYRPLDRLDWHTLLEGLKAPESPQREVLEAMRSGTSVAHAAIDGAGFMAADAQWLKRLCDVTASPQRALADLRTTKATSFAEVYVREHLEQTLGVTPLNLELVAFASKRRLSGALERYGDQAALFFVRARASALLGFTKQVLDDLARAVYFSRNQFHAQAVLDLGFIEEERPALWQACQERLAQLAE